MSEVVSPWPGSHPATPHSEAETGGQEAGRYHLEGRGRAGVIRIILPVPKHIVHIKEAERGGGPLAISQK